MSVLYNDADGMVTEYTCNMLFNHIDITVLSYYVIIEWNSIGISSISKLLTYNLTSLQIIQLNIFKFNFQVTGLFAFFIRWIYMYEYLDVQYIIRISFKQIAL